MKIRTLLSLAIAVLCVAVRAQTPAPDLAKNPAPVRTTLNPALPTLFIAGDSTAAKGRGEIQQGWAEPFVAYFDAAKINIANRARGGRSSRTFITEGLWEGIVKDLKAGDIVLIQFGHNDGGALNDEPPPPLRARGSIPGLGEETKEIDNVLTKKHEVVHTFGWYMRKMIAETKAKGATPIVLNLTLRNIWKDGKIERTSRYSKWAAEIAQAEGVAFFDLSGTVADQFEKQGEEKTKALYQQDHTHFNLAGADIHAAAVVGGLKKLPGNPVGKFLSEKGAVVAEGANSK